MSQDDQNSDPAPIRDSRLEAFLRQASAIIAAEKGLNNAAKAKLDELAQRLHLPDELFETGLSKLQDSNSPIGELTHYEQGFLDFLVKEFSQMPKGTVLSISIEGKAIEHAKKKFEIPSHRAEKLIEYQTLESGIGRLSRSDAKDFGRQMILDHVGEQVSLDERTEKRVFRIGRRWGCPQEEVEKLLEDKFAENRRLKKAEQRRPLVLGLASLFCVAIIGAVSWWLVANREMIFGKPVVEKDPIPLVSDLVEEPVVSTTAKSELEELFPDMDSSLTSQNSATRGDAIAEITKRIIASPREQSAQVQAIQSWYFSETDPAIANRLVQEVDKALGAEPRTDRNGALGVPYRAAAIALSISQASVNRNQSPRRTESLAQVLKNRTGVEWADRSGAGMDPIDSAIAVRQWNQLIQRAWTSSGRSSVLVEPLADLTRPKLSVKVHQQFVSRSVRTIITADKTQWRNMRSAIRDAIRAADEVQRMEWIDVWLDQFDGTIGFREFAAPLLVAGREAEAPVRSDKEYEILLRTARSDWRNRLLRPALSRHQKISEKIEQLRTFVSVSSDSKAKPDLIFQSASAANLCLETIAITKAGRAGDESAWSDVDVQLKRFDQRLRDFVFLEEPQNSGVPKVSSAGFDTTNRDKTLGAFSDLSNFNQAKRLAAIERLPKITARFDSIPQPMAKVLAKYLLSPIEPDEWLQMQRVLPDLAKWPRLVLAVSDQLPDTTAPIDQVVTMFAVLTGETWEATGGDWRDRLANELLKFAHESLSVNAAVDPNSSDSDWLRLEKYLSSSYYRRSILLGGDGLASDRSALNLSRQCVRAVNDNAAATERVIGLIEGSTENEMERIVLFNRQLSQGKESNGSVSVGSRLLESELDLLLMWNREREEQLKGMMDEN